MTTTALRRWATWLSAPTRRRLVPARTAIGALVIAAILATAGDALGSPSRRPAAREPASGAAGRNDAGLSPRVRALAVRSPEHDASVAAVFATEDQLAEARRAELAHQQLQIDLAEQLDELSDNLRRFRRDRQGAVSRFAAARSTRDMGQDALDQAQADIGELAATAYTGADENNPLDRSATVTPAQLRTVYSDELLAAMLVRRRSAQSRRDAGALAMDEATGARLLAESNIDTARQTIEVTRQRLDQAARDEVTTRQLQVALTARLDGERRTVARARRTANVVGLDFTLVVLDTYVAAERTLARTDPDCGIRWESIAAIARTESRHGTHGGAIVAADGSLSRPIIGIPLDGTNGTLAIADTDGGRLDGDEVNDRAVGPLQFIPTSWARFGRDGNGDGVIDPHNMYDASLSAGVHLCAPGSSMNSNAGLREAYFSYNRSSAYAESVLQRTVRYDRFGL